MSRQKPATSARAGEQRADADDGDRGRAAMVGSSRCASQVGRGEPASGAAAAGGTSNAGRARARRSVRSCCARVTTAAPSSRLRAICDDACGSPGSARNDAARPRVERAHRRAAPDLVVDRRVGVAVDRPAARLARGTSGTRAPCGASDRARRASTCAGRARARTPRVSPRPRRAVRARISRLELRARRRRGSPRATRGRGTARRACGARTANIVPRLSTCTLTPSSNMSAAGAIVTSAMLGLGEHRLAVVGEARLDGSLVDRAGEHVGGAERERRGDGARACRARRPRRSRIGRA